MAGGWGKESPPQAPQCLLPTFSPNFTIAPRYPWHVPACCAGQRHGQRLQGWDSNRGLTGPAAL